MFYFTKISSPLGNLFLVEKKESLTAIEFSNQSTPSISTPNDAKELWKEEKTPLLTEVENQLKEYFIGERKTFDLPLAPRGTLFQFKVWEILKTIPYGTTMSYGEQSMQIGGIRYSRAVGGANGKNPIPIIIPCHRVIGKKGELGGFSSGVDKKRWLLRHEEKHR